MSGVDGGFADAADEDGGRFGELLNDADAVAHVIRLLIHRILQLSDSIRHVFNSNLARAHGFLCCCLCF